MAMTQIDHVSTPNAASWLFQGWPMLVRHQGEGVMRIGSLAVRFFLRASIVVALVFFSFAHTPVDFSSSQPHDLSASVLPDGSLLDLCFGTGGAGTEDEAGHADVCEFCKIAGSVALAMPDRSGKPAYAAKVQPLFPPEAKHVVSLAWRLLPPKQGPPSIVI